MKNYLFKISVKDQEQFTKVIKKMVMLGLKKDGNFLSRKINNPIGLKDEAKRSVHIVRASVDEKLVSSFLSVPSVKDCWCLSENIPFD